MINDQLCGEYGAVILAVLIVNQLDNDIAMYQQSSLLANNSRPFAQPKTSKKLNATG